MGIVFQKVKRKINKAKLVGNLMLANFGTFYYFWNFLPINRKEIDIRLFEEGIQFKFKENKKQVKKLILTDDIIKITSFKFSGFQQIVLFIISMFGLSMSIFLFLGILIYVLLKYYLAKIMIINTVNNSFIVSFDKLEDINKYKLVFCSKWKHKCSFFKKEKKKKKE